MGANDVVFTGTSAGSSTIHNKDGYKTGFGTKYDSGAGYSGI